MTNKRLFRIVLGVIGFFCVYIILGVLLRFNIPDQRVYETYKDLMPLFIALPSAFLAAAFQRRLSYLQALRKLWSDLIPIVRQAIDYTYLEKPSRDDFNSVMRGLSVVIDSLREVFKNLNESETDIGLYPYESLKDIKKIIRWVGFGGGRSMQDRMAARVCIKALWSKLHNNLLREFDRAVPTHPISRFYTKKYSFGEKLTQDLLDGNIEDIFDKEYKRKTERVKFLTQAPPNKRMQRRPRIESDEFQ